MCQRPFFLSSSQPTTTHPIQFCLEVLPTELTQGGQRRKLFLIYINWTSDSVLNKVIGPVDNQNENIMFKFHMRPLKFPASKSYPLQYTLDHHERRLQVVDVFFENPQQVLPSQMAFHSCFLP